MIFNSFSAFFAVYIPLVLLAVLAVVFEERLIRFEQKLKRKIKKWVKESVTGTNG